MPDYEEIIRTFTGVNNTRIYYQSWQVKSPRGVIVIAHGLGEHCGRYENLIRVMEHDGISFYALDHRGHGRSEGSRGHINAFSEYLDDLKQLFELVHKENQGIPIILLGHSMGGVIAFQYALNHPRDINGLILSSAGLIPAVEIPGWEKRLAGILSRIAPALAMSNGINCNDLSHDQNVVEAYESDSLVHDRVSSRWFIEFTRAGAECLHRAPELEIPLLIIHGAADKIVDYRGSKQVMAQASSHDKQLCVFEGLYHETMNEVPAEREKVLKCIREWILHHLLDLPD